MRLIRVTSLTPNALDFACHSKACAPPPVGKGGSNEGGASGGSVHPDAEGIFRAVKGMSPGAGRQFPTAKDAQDMRNMQSAMYAAAGYNGKARVVGAAQFDELVGRGKEFEEAWRGVAAFDQTKTADQIGRGLIDDDTHFPGNGIYGNGTYFAHNSASPSLGQATAKDYGPMLTRGGIPKSMRETKVADINMAVDYVKQILEADTYGPGQFEGDSYVRSSNPGPMELSAHKVVEAGRKAGLNNEEIRGVTRDAGRMAILMGVSGYTAPQKNGVDYVVVLNRGALVLDRTVHDETSRGGYIPQEGYTRQGLKRGGEDLSADTETFHLSGKHNQKTHGRGGSGAGGRVVIGPGMVPKNAGKVIAAGAARESEQEMQLEMYKAAGFNGRGTVVSRGEFNDLMDEGNLEEGWRGVVDSSSPAFGTDLERKIARSLIDDDYHFPGRGIYGNGTYVAYQEDSTHSARQAASLYGENLLRIGMSKSITETSFDDVNAVEEAVADYVYGDGPYMGQRPTNPKKAVAYDTAKALVNSARAEGVEDFDIVAALGDTGRVAIALGLDGYTVKREPGSPGAEYTVVLNRSAVTLDRTVYDESGILSRHLADGYDNLGEKT